MVGERARETADKKGRLVLSGREVPWVCRSALVQLLSANPGRSAVSGRQPSRQPMHVHMDMHMQPRLVMLAVPVLPPAIPRPPGRVRIEARAGRRVIAGCERLSDRPIWTQKNPAYMQRRQASRFLAPYLAWRQEAANHHENQL